MLEKKKIRIPTPEIRQRKILPYTVSIIGDKEALKTWKIEREAFEAEWKAKAAHNHELRKAIAVQMIADQFHRLEASEEDQLIDVRSGKRKLAKKVIETIYEPQAEPTLKEKVIDFIGKLLSNVTGGEK